MPTRYTRRPILMIGALLTFVGVATLPAQDVGTGAVLHAQSPYSAAETITAQHLRQYVYFLASPELGGRWTPSAGLGVAARFIETYLASWQLTPAGDSSFRQAIQLDRFRVDSATTSLRFGGREVSLGEGGFRTWVAPGRGSGPLVYVGHGWQLTEHNVDPYREMDVEGRIVVVREGFPDGLTASDAIRRPRDVWADPYRYAMEHGALGLVLIPSPARSLWEFRSRTATGTGVLSVAALRDRAAPPSRRVAYRAQRGSVASLRMDPGLTLPVVVPSAELVAALFEGEPLSAEALRDPRAGDDIDRPFAFRADKRLELVVQVQAESEYIFNMTALLEGRDPALRDEYVLVGAHYDHLGGEKMGADDNASGSSALLAIAEAFARGPRPRRSVLFTWFAGEERDLWGSKYAVKHGIPPEKIVTVINLDMIGRTGAGGGADTTNFAAAASNQVYVVGARYSSEDLSEVVDDVNRRFLRLDYMHWNQASSWPFSGSDHAPYDEAGVPFVWFFTGIHEDYHGAGDTPDKLDYDKLERIARTVYVTAWELAERPERPARRPAGR